MLPSLDTIECRDALLNDDGSEAAWPAAECIVGNPPFLGDKMMRSRLGDAYVDRLRGTYAGRVPGGADLVCYWFEKARAQIAAGAGKRAGLVATNSVRGGANRRVLDKIEKTPGQVIFEAWADEEWFSDGAAVRVSLICFGSAPSGRRRLDGHDVQTIHADLTGAGLDLTRARRLPQNAGVGFIGIQKTGPFDITGQTARAMLTAPQNPDASTNSRVVRPIWNGIDVTRRPTDGWIVDFGPDMPQAHAALFEQPYAYLDRVVRPVRATNRQAVLRENWWLHEKPRADMRRAIAGLARIIVTPRVAKHRVFVWLNSAIDADCQLIVIARDDDTTFGILHSRFHEAWALRLGTSLEDRPRYTPTTTFETFPFPAGLTPNLPAASYTADPRAIAIATAAARLNQLRENWLNPADLVQRSPEVVPDLPHRLLPKDDAAAKLLAKRTLTNLYNERPRWLADAHAALDAAVAAAYGWPADVSEDDALAALLALNLARTS